MLKPNERRFIAEIQKIIQNVNTIEIDSIMAVYAEAVEKLCEQFLVRKWGLCER